MNLKPYRGPYEELNLDIIKLKMKTQSENEEKPIKNLKAIIHSLPEYSKVQLDGVDLGLVQAVNIQAGLGRRSSMVIETICDEAQVEVLQEDTKMVIEIKDSAARQKGFNSVFDGTQNEYPEGSYGDFLFKEGFKEAMLKRIGQDIVSEISNKLTPVDARFVVSSKDLSEALSRVGNSAEDSGASFDQLIELIAEIQKRTGIGGKAIGEALKLIYK